VARVIRQQAGVEKAVFHRDKAELSVAYKSSKTSTKKLIHRVKEMGFVALKGAGKGAYRPSIKFLPSMDFRLISKNGEAVRLTDHLAANKVTVFDFTAKWCGPCKDIARALFQIMLKNKAVALRKINVVSWDKPIAKQFKLPRLPYLILYDKNGKKSQVIVGRKIEQLKQAILRLTK